MPVALMNGAGSSLSPTSPKVSKAAFFRARSPQPQTTTNNDNDLSARFNLAARIREPSPANINVLSPLAKDDYDRGVQDMRIAASSLEPAVSTHTDNLDETHVRRMTQRRLPAEPAPTPQDRSFAVSGPSATVDSHGDRYENSQSGSESVWTGATGNSTGVAGLADGSHDMFLSLLAGQAVVDCETMSVSGWEEVEGWKKELSLLANRLESLQARHQREIKILTAARTLQKLNNTNKRMSKATLESLEQSEKRVAAAEKEVLVLRDREASLRRQLMEHWAGVMAWEIRRLERATADAQVRQEHLISAADMSHKREEVLAGRIAVLEKERDHAEVRITELEEMVLEFGRRERALEEEARVSEEEKRQQQADREDWLGKQRTWEEERESLLRDRTADQVGRASSLDRGTIERLRSGLATILHRKSGVDEADIANAFDEVRALLDRRERDVLSLKEEMREINMGLEEEVRRLGQDRDAWKAHAEGAEQSQHDVAEFQRKLRVQSDQVSDLELRNESLAASLAAAHKAMATPSPDATSTKALEAQVTSLSAELDSIAMQLTMAWSVLPTPAARAQAGLTHPAAASPNHSIDFGAIQRAYAGSSATKETFGGVDELVERVRSVVDDGRLLVERMGRMDVEKERHKANATKAAKLVDDSRHALETYQKQVAMLEDQLAKSGSSESHFLEELNSLRSSLEEATAARRALEAQAEGNVETVSRLAEVNGTLSARTLTLADEAEQEKRALQARLQMEIDNLKRQLDRVQEDADENKLRGQAQRIQLLDELNSLQAEVADLRKKLREARPK